MAGKFWDKGIMLVTGCTKVSPGCRGCWSEKAHSMRCHNKTVARTYNPDLLTDGRFNGKVQVNMHLLEKAAKRREPTVYAIWNDLYHEGVTDEQILNVTAVMARNPQHTYLIVTKRPERAAEFWSEFLTLASSFAHAAMMEELWPDIWHIVTAENQAMLDERGGHLLRIPGKRGLILEPMLGGIDLNFMWGTSDNIPRHESIMIRDAIHQVIMGGETGSGARPMHPEWVRSVRDQCAAAGVPFYFKSWGAFEPCEFEDGKGHLKIYPNGQWYSACVGDEDRTDVAIIRHNTKAGRLLDGREHNDLAWRAES